MTLVEAAALGLDSESLVAPLCRAGSAASSLFHTSAAAGAAKNKTRRRTEVPGTARSRSYASATGVDGWARFELRVCFPSVFTGALGLISLSCEGLKNHSRAVTLPGPRYFAHVYA